jgi:hypothetical protein
VDRLFGKIEINPLRKRFEFDFRFSVDLGQMTIRDATIFTLTTVVAFICDAGGDGCHGA